jgi:hypothetical protein
VNGGNAASQVASRHIREAGAAHQLGESLLIRKVADTLDEIAIGLGRARGKRAEARNEFEGIEVVFIVVYVLFLF